MKQIVNIPASQIIDETMGVIQLVPKDGIPEHIVEEIVILVPHVMDETTETVKIIPQERVQNRTVEQITDVLMLQVQEEIVEVSR